LIGQVSLLMLAAFERIQACVGSDFVKPGAHRSSVETRKAAPCAQIGFLHQIFGFVQRAKHPIAMQPDLAAEWFGEPFELPVRVVRFGLDMGALDRHCV